MKFIKKFDEYNINESVLPIEDIYSKYYSDIDKVIFYKIIQADPTTKFNKVGKYSKWLLNLFKTKNLKLEDLYKATEYLKTFDMFKHNLPIKVINNIKSLPELFQLVEPYIEREEEVFENDTEKKLAGQFKEIFKNSEYRIIVPLTLKASKYFGRGTEWCTLGSDMFKKYTVNQDVNNLDENCLYILYNYFNEDTGEDDERLQFHFEERQFMDVDDSPIDIRDFFNENEDIATFFNSLFNTRIYVEYPDVLIPELCEEYGIKCNVITYNEMEEMSEEGYVWDGDFDILIEEHFDYDENPMDGSGTVAFNFLAKNHEAKEKFSLMLEDIYKHSNIEIDKNDGIYRVDMSL